MRNYSQTFTAAGTWSLQVGGDFLRLISSPDVVDVKFFRNGAEIHSAVGMDSGFWVKPAGGFDRVDIVSATAQTVKIMVGSGEGGYDQVPINQAVVVYDRTAVSVGVTATALVAQSMTRRGVRFTNAGTSPVYLGSSSVTVAAGAIMLTPGNTWIENDGAPAAWYGISAVAGQSIKIQELG